MSKNSKLKITDVTFRDANQSLLATRIKIDDLLPIAHKMDQVGFHSLETWGGATFDACIRFLNEDPWARLRAFTKAMPNTPQQMLLRGQNLLGYRHYADDVVEKFIDRSAECGIQIFRIFDALNDVRNIKTAIDQVVSIKKHAQGVLCYTTSPIHTFASWIDLAKRIEDMGAHSLCIKDMAGLLDPYYAFCLVKELKKNTQLPIQLHTHSTTGFSVATVLKAVEAGVDGVDTAIGSMSMTYGHPPTNTVVSMFENTSSKTDLDLKLLEEIDHYFAKIRGKYSAFEGTLKGIDSRILRAQVPGGMLTNMENQLKQQKAHEKFDEVLEEIPKVREDLGFLPLVTPTSQIVGTQAVANVITGKRYQLMTQEVSDLLLGRYGQTPAPVNLELQQRALKKGGSITTKRPADLLENEWKSLCLHFKAALASAGLDHQKLFNTDNVLIYALFSNVALEFFKQHYANHTTPKDALESSKTTSENVTPKSTLQKELFSVSVNHKNYIFAIGKEGEIDQIIHLDG